MPHRKESLGKIPDTKNITYKAKPRKYVISLCFKEFPPPKKKINWICHALGKVIYILYLFPSGSANKPLKNCAKKGQKATQDCTKPDEHGQNATENLKTEGHSQP